jgi:hypothetical protein
MSPGVMLFVREANGLVRGRNGDDAFGGGVLDELGRSFIKAGCEGDKVAEVLSDCADRLLDEIGKVEFCTVAAKIS